MLLETFIGLGLFIYILWKYLLPSKQEQIQYEKPQDIQPTKIEKELDSAVNKVVPNDPALENVETKRQIFESIKSDRKHDVENNVSFKPEEIITPSVLLKQRNEKLLGDKVVRRESPPKEKLAEFLEKTILSDDKIQSIIQNLSLDKTELLIHEGPTKVHYSTSEVIEPLVKQEGHTISEKAAELQNTIDAVADRIKRFNGNNLVKDSEQPADEDVENKTDENKPVLKRLQKQPGFPQGLNFGSVIGELKNKTKNASNGGLKPVFKKFDVDSVDNVQAGFFFYSVLKKS